MSKPSRGILILAILSSVGLGFLGILYILASAIEPMRFPVGVTLILAAFLIAVLSVRKFTKRPPLVVRWSPSGPIKLEELISRVYRWKGMSRRC